MKGAIVFLAAFLLFLVITLGYQGLPPGKAIYDFATGEEQADFEVLGLHGPSLVSAIFNGVIYGVIVFFIYWLAERFIFGKRKTKIEIKST